MKEYNVNSIKKMEALDHIRQRPGMYIGDTETATNLLIECLDNSLDEVHNNYADTIKILINTKQNYFSVGDNGRGIPFDLKLPIEKDPPVLICNSIFTSGKFDKDSDESAYKVSSGLHGVGMTCVNALSKHLIIDLFKKNKHVRYCFGHDTDVTRSIIKDIESPKHNMSTFITVFPSEKYFESNYIDINKIENKLYIAIINYPKLNIYLKIDDDVKNIKIDEAEFLLKHLGNVDQWFSFENCNKKDEKCIFKFGWELDQNSTKIKTFTTVNLLHVLDGAHINKALSILKNILLKVSNKNNIEIDESDITNWLRIYINLHVINCHFESQTKEKLSKKTDLSLFDDIEKNIEKYFKTNGGDIITILKKLEEYKKSQHNKKLLKNNLSTKKRGTSMFTKLRDCTKSGGELLIGEGESAINGLIQVRDPNKHAILPLKGVPINVLNHNINNVLNNQEVKDLISATGCGISPHCNINQLRYKSIIIAADADPDGMHIASLLIILFAKLMPEIIKNGKLYVCETPLFGYGHGDNFIPLWSQNDLNEARKTKKDIRRFKGLGEFNPNELKKFTLDIQNRKLVQIVWSKQSEKIFELLNKSGSENRKKLSIGEWNL